MEEIMMREVRETEITSAVAKWLESAPVRSDTKQIVQVWTKLGLPLPSLAEQLRKLIERVNARANGDGHNLTNVDWEAVATHCAEEFS